MDHRVYLKVKVKSLAAEAKIIRKEERKSKKFRAGLAEHRRSVVRSEARHTLLAYAFVRGRKYREVEEWSRIKPDWARVKKMVDRYGLQYDHENESYITYRQLKSKEAERLEAWKI